MHILITDPHTDGGGQVRYIQCLVGELLQKGHQVTIGCRPNSVLKAVALESGCDALPAFYFARGFRLPQWLADIRTLRSFVRETGPDIVHTNGSQDHWVAGLAQRNGAGGMCLLRTRHNTYTVKDSFPNRYLNRRATTFQICVCDMVRSSLANHLAFDGDRMTAIHNGVDADLYSPKPEVRQRVREELGYSEGDLVCGVAARLVKAKGHTYLFQALQLLAEELPEIRVLLFGQGALEAQLRAEAKTLGIDSIIQFAGFRDDMQSWIQAFDIGVLPSIDCDTSSFSLKEQMATEIPVITSDYGGLTEIVTDGDEGLVVPHGTVSPLADALRKLARDATLRREMGRRGRERVLREFTRSVFGTKTIEAYNRALELRHERTPS